MTLSGLVQPLTELARPFSIYLSGLAVAIGVFVPSVSQEKLWVAAAVAGGVSLARSIDKRAAARAAMPDQPVKKENE